MHIDLHPHKTTPAFRRVSGYYVSFYLSVIYRNASIRWNPY